MELLSSAHSFKSVTLAVLCYPIRGEEILLQRKASNLFGEGRWNGPGGKVKNGESPEQAARREVSEETGLVTGDLTFHGILCFYYAGSKPAEQIVFVFSCNQFSGTLRDSSEGRLEWFPVSGIPYDEMWEDDRFWLPLFLQGKRFVGSFWFNQGKLVEHAVQRVESD